MNDCKKTQFVRSLDSPTNLKKSLKQMFFAYLQTPDADCQKKRQEIIVLYRALMAWF